MSRYPKGFDQYLTTLMNYFEYLNKCHCDNIPFEEEKKSLEKLLDLLIGKNIEQEELEKSILILVKTTEYLAAESMNAHLAASQINNCCFKKKD